MTTHFKSKNKNYHCLGLIYLQIFPRIVVSKLAIPFSLKFDVKTLE